MTNLEFIEKEINAYKQLKECAILRIAVEDDEIELYKLQRHINTLNERIPIFQQIKEELEAWEIVKTDSVISVLFKDLANGDSVNYHKLSKEKQETLRKALEKIKND